MGAHGIPQKDADYETPFWLGMAYTEGKCLYLGGTETDEF